MSSTDFPLQYKNQHKRRHALAAPTDLEPSCAKRACSNLQHQGRRDDSEDLESLSWLDDVETAGNRSWLDGVDERAIWEMMRSLEHDIRSNEQQDAEDSSSSSSYPLRSNNRSYAASADGETQWGFEGQTSDSECSFNFWDESTASIDEEVQQVLQQSGDDLSILPKSYANWDAWSEGSSDDHRGATSAPVRASADGLSGQQEDEEFKCHSSFLNP